MPIVDIKEELKRKKENKLKFIQEKLDEFLKDKEINNYVLTITLECVYCQTLCTCKEAPIFECPICHFQWNVEEIPLGFKEV